MINGKRRVITVWNSISMEEKVKDLERISVQISFTYRQLKRPLNSPCQDPIEAY